MWKVPLAPVATPSPTRHVLAEQVDEHKTVLQLISEGKATGDAWLSHAGRRVVPGPELRRGRKNLFDVVHHTCAEGLRQHPTFTGTGAPP